MSRTVTVDGTNYTLPTAGDADWGTNFDQWARAVSAASGTTETVIYNVKDPAYGAVGNNTANDAPAIQAAINAAADSTYGGVIYFPPGEYNVRSTLNIPRIGWSGQKTLIFRGDGVTGTSITDSGYLGSSSPMWQIAQTPTGTSAAYMVFENMTWARSGDGTVFKHACPTGNTGTERLIRCEFRNLYIRGKAPSTGTVTEETLDIEAGIECKFYNVWGDGGNIWARFKACSHMECFGFGTTTDTYSTNGLLVDGGGTHFFHNTRIEGQYGGYGIKLTGGVTNVHLNGVSYEGKNTSPLLDIDSADSVLITASTFGALPITDPTYGRRDGITVRAAGKDVTILNSRFALASGGYGIVTESGAKHIRGDGLFFYGGNASNVSFAAGTVNCQIRGYGGTNADNRFTASKGYLGSVTANVTTFDASEFEHYSLAMVGATNLDNMTGGSEGEVKTLLFTNSNTTVRHIGGGTGNIRTASGADVAGAANKSIQFMFDGTNWIQI